MKDYSKYFGNPEGFILKYDVTYDILDGERNRELKVYTADSMFPKVYKLDDPSMIIKVEKRLEEQYRAVLSNRETIKVDYMSKKIKMINNILVWFIALVSVPGAIISIAWCVLWPFLTCILLFVLSAITAKSCIKKIGYKFDEEMDLYQTYLDNMLEIDSKYAWNSKRINDYLSFRAERILEYNKRLRMICVTKTAFNIDFMDKVSLSDLRNLLQIYASEQAIFDNESNDFVCNENKGMKRVLKKK